MNWGQKKEVNDWQNNKKRKRRWTVGEIIICKNLNKPFGWCKKPVKKILWLWCSWRISLSELPKKYLDILLNFQQQTLLFSYHYHHFNRQLSIIFRKKKKYIKKFLLLIHHTVSSFLLRKKITVVLHQMDNRETI